MRLVIGISGSFGVDGMMAAPCCMKTLSAIVHSYADSLAVRAADGGDT